MTLANIGADNPDQRIAVDIDRFIDSDLQLLHPPAGDVSSLVSFSIILWTISADFTIPGTEVVIPASCSGWR